MDDYRRKVAAHYGPAVEAYRRWWAPVLLAFARPLLDRLKERRPAAPAGAFRCLDLGCGVGSLEDDLRAVSGAGADLVAADMTREMLHAARETASVSARTDFVLLDAARLPFFDQSFDLIVSAFVLHHVREQHRAVAEACRVLRPDGRLAIATWGVRDEGNAAFTVVEEMLAEFGAPETDPLDFEAWTDEVAAPERLAELLQAVGFRRVQAWAEEREYRWTAETLGNYRMKIGNTSRRLVTLPRSRQAAFARALAARLDALPPEAFVWRPEVVFAIASRA